MKKILSQKGEITTIALMTILLAALVIPVATKLVQQNQDLQKHASSAPACPQGSTDQGTHGECCGCNTAQEVRNCKFENGSTTYTKSSCDHTGQSTCSDLCPSPTTSSPTQPPSSSKTCLPGCCGGDCGSCPEGQACNIPNGACPNKLSCNPDGYEYHLSCRDYKCVRVPGPQADDQTCSTNQQCNQDQKQICKPEDCCGDGLKCNGSGTACNIPSSACEIQTGCYPGNCCSQGKRCDDQSKCTTIDQKCTSTTPTPTPKPSKIPTPTFKQITPISQTTPTLAPSFTPKPTKTPTPIPAKSSTPTLRQTTPIYEPTPTPIGITGPKKIIAVTIIPTPRQTEKQTLCEGKNEGDCCSLTGRCLQVFGDSSQGLSCHPCFTGQTCVKGQGCIYSTPTNTPPTPIPSTSASELFPPCSQPNTCHSDGFRRCAYYPVSQTEIKLGYVPCPAGYICLETDSKAECLALPPTPTTHPRVSKCQGVSEGECLDESGLCLTFFGGGQLNGKIAYQPCPAGQICSPKKGCVQLELPLYYQQSETFQLISNLTGITGAYCKSSQTLCGFGQCTDCSGNTQCDGSSGFAKCKSF